MNKEKRRNMIQGIRLARGITEEQAKERVKFIEKIGEKADELMGWIKCESEGRSREEVELLLISTMLCKYKKKKRDFLIRTLHEVTVLKHENVLKNARRVKELGELKRT